MAGGTAEAPAATTAEGISETTEEENPEFGQEEAALENSHLLLSTQEGELRTEPVSDADKYNYGTLRR